MQDVLNGSSPNGHHPEFGAPGLEQPEEKGVPVEAQPEVQAPGASDPLVAAVEGEVADEASPAHPAAEPASADEPDAASEPVVDLESPLPVGKPVSGLSLAAQVESLLFVADGPVPVGRVAEALDVKSQAVEQALDELTGWYEGRGIAIQRMKDRVQLTSTPAAAEAVQRFLGLSASAPLSRAGLETLAIIAYRQPITRPQIDAIRGVNSDGVMKTLLTKGLIEEAGIGEGPGRPTLYVTTSDFLQHFGLSSINELPPLNLDDLKRTPTADILKG